MRTALVTLVALIALTGCSIGGKDDEPPKPTASAVPSPTGLATSLRAFSIGSYRFKVVAKEGSYTGAIDPVAGMLDASVSVRSDGASLKIDTIGVHGSAYTRLTGLPLPGFDGNTWFRVDQARVTRPGALGLSAIADPTGVQALVAATHDVRRSGGTYSGTVDMTRVNAWGPVDIARVVQLGAVARAVPFEATVDGQDRLLTMKVNIPDNPVEAAYSDFGSPVTVTAPSSAEPLPDHLYGMLGL
ncbi:hypothetical protein GCM10010399_74160 [Dactylosporangium fulvum]|uniref:Lipoprotein n=1 Tax=Dactylosporangium fulvum TaxID=53359 RepID=A0ABY5W2Q6_9ACTN|nr:hypothetical protein [Dactylosporangium fulvum]UWP84227.1 hypothetical protein Dfulv_08305 [Dactylosporangium fulvum]